LKKNDEEKQEKGRATWRSTSRFKVQTTISTFGIWRFCPGKG
jgi:hypothetical protein